jgi:hypothetical protein
MAHGLVIKPEAEPPAINQATLELGSVEARDALVMRAAAKVAAAHECCLMMWGEEAARDPSFAVADEERREALIELAELPAASSGAFATKFDIFIKMVPWLGREDPDLFDCFVRLSRDANSLMLTSDPGHRAIAVPPRAAALHRSVRWLFGVAFSGII